MNHGGSQNERNKACVELSFTNAINNDKLPIRLFDALKF